MLFSAAASAAAGPGFTGLGTLPGDDNSLALGVSADGTVVVGATGLGGNYHDAFRWTHATGMVSIGVGGQFAFAHAVSGDGQVVVGVGDPDGGGNSAFRWTQAGGMVRLSKLPGWTYADAYSVSFDGSVVSGYGYSPSGKRAVRWVNAGVGGGVMESLGTLSTNCGALSFSQGYGGVSADGTVISGDGSADVQFCSGHAFRWTSNGAGGGTMQDLGHLPGQFATDSLAFGLSADGQVVVGSSQASNNDQAFRWTAAGGMQDIGFALTAGEGWSEASAVNADGSVVVGWAAVPEIHAFMWTPALGSVDLNTYLPTVGINLSDWLLKYATGVSADGRTIVGYGEHFGFQYNEAYIVTLPPASCYPDCNADGSLTVADFGCFQTRFVAGDPYADCNGDGARTVADFGCFQTKFVAGCP